MITIDKLYETYQQALYRYLHALTRDAHLTEDLLSETFCCAITSLPRFRGDADVKSWLFTIARNKWMDHLRKKVPAADMDLAEVYIADTAPGPEQRVMLKAAAQRVRELLAQEDERTRRIVSMRMEGLSFYEIGKKLNIREGSARVMDFRARAKLRKILTEEGYHEIL